MHVMQGEAGRAGSPARLPTAGWSDYLAPGCGAFRISVRGGSSGEIQWVPESPEGLLDAGDYHQYHGFNWPLKGGLAAEIWEPWSDSPIESTYDAPQVESDRLAGPIQFILKLLEFWRLEPKDVVGLLGFDPSDTDHVAAVLAGHEQLRGRDVRDRISHLFWIHKTLWTLFRDLKTENEWLKEPHSMLDDRSPVSLPVDGSMEDILLAREYADAVAVGVAQS